MRSRGPKTLRDGPNALSGEISAQVLHTNRSFLWSHIAVDGR